MNDKMLRDYFTEKRRALLTELEELEKLLGISPTTATLRKKYKQEDFEKKQLEKVNFVIE